MPVEGAAPSVEHSEKASIHLPVVALEGLERFGDGGKQQVACDTIIMGEELVELLRHGENNMEVRAIRQPLADLFGPLCLAWAEAVRAMAIAAGTRIPL